MSKEQQYKTEFKKWSVENRLTAQVISEAVGCSKKSVYAYMQGYRLPSRKTMKKMEQALGINAREMFDI